jgi:2',3'-cyclic-nucleotide 2'-phosphodiesterase (5'-nucleotidase family)
MMNAKNTTTAVASLHLTSGDMVLVGPFFEASAEIKSWGSSGVGDVQMLNYMDLQAACIGNHEVDVGLDVFATFLREATFPMVSVNLDFTNVSQTTTPNIKLGTDGGLCSDNGGTIVKSCYVETPIGRIGIVARTPDDLFNLVENSQETLAGLDFVGGRNAETNVANIPSKQQLQEQINMLESQKNADIIILLDHGDDPNKYANFVKEIVGIDIIITSGKQSLCKILFSASLNCHAFC